MAAKYIAVSPTIKSVKSPVVIFLYRDRRYMVSTYGRQNAVSTIEIWVEPSTNKDGHWREVWNSDKRATEISIALAPIARDVLKRK